MEMRNVSIAGATGNSPKNVTDDPKSQKFGDTEAAKNPQTGISPITGKEKYENSISESTMLKAIDKANKALEPVYRRFEYSVHERTGEIIVKVIDQAKDEVIREIPNEKFLDLMANLQDLIGLNIDEKR